jgi:hypothetical protein
MASIAKASISNLMTDSDAQVVVGASTVLAAIALAVVTFGTPSPALAIVQTALDDFIAAINEAEMGGAEQTAIKNVKREELVGLLRLLAFYVTVTCKGNIPKLLSSGFPIQEPGTNTPVGRCRRLIRRW